MSPPYLVYMTVWSVLHVLNNYFHIALNIQLCTLTALAQCSVDEHAPLNIQCSVLSIDEHAPLNIQCSVLMSVDEHAPLNIQYSVLMSTDEHVPLNIQCSVPNVIGGFARALSPISIQKWPFSNSALQHLQLLSFGANFCCPATTVAEFFSCTREKFCFSATTRAECFSPEKYSALLLPQQRNVSQQQNVSHQQQNSVLVLPQKHSAVLVP